MTIDRVPSKYSNRLRRLLDKTKAAVEALDARVVVVEAASDTIIDSTSVDINGTTSETVSDPTDYGQILVRSVNTVTSAGTHTVNLNGYYYAPGPYAISGMGSGSAGAIFTAHSGKKEGGWVWHIESNAGWSEVV